MDDVHWNDAPVWRIHVVVYAVGRNRMTKREAYKRVFGKEAIHIEGIDWNSEVDDAFEMELEVIKQMVEGMQNESNTCD